MITLTIQGQDEMLTKLATVSDKSARRAIMDDFGSYLVAEVQQRFRTETGPDGEVWKKSKRVEAEGGLTLSDTGHLKNFITHKASADTLEVGTAVKYAAIHQFGGDIKPKKAKELYFMVGGHLVKTKKVTIPARPFLGFTDGDREEFNAIVQDHWQEVLQ